MKLPQKTLKLWRIRLAVLFSLTIVILISLSAFFRWLILPAVFIFVLFLCLELWLLPAFLARYEIILNDDFLQINKGIIFKSKTLLPKRWIINLKTLKLPDSKAMGLGLLMIKTYKGVVLIPELTEEAINEIIKAVLGENKNEHQI